jgi:osmoprotectant transport system permease protein
VAPNRLLPGEAIGAPAALGPAAHLPALLLAGALLAGRRRPRLAPALPLAGIVLALAATGLAAARLMEGQPPAARASLGAGFWLFMASAGLLALEQARAAGQRPAWTVLAVLLAGVALWRWGLLDALSLAVEYRARQEAVQAALWRHLALSAAALGLALAAALPLGWWAFRSARAEAAIGAALGFVQVVPSLALFGLLIPLLSLLLGALPALRAAGLQAIGPAPALIAVAAYLALPLWRALLGGLGAADPAAVEAARAMGMTEGRITAEIRLPLGLPVFAGGLRVAGVQAIGLVTLGGLIGAGGLGALVFEGMAQFAADLILLGALPVILLALLADTALRGLETRLAESVR